MNHIAYKIHSSLNYALFITFKLYDYKFVFGTYVVFTCSTVQFCVMAFNLVRQQEEKQTGRAGSSTGQKHTYIVICDF